MGFGNTENTKNWRSFFFFKYIHFVCLKHWFGPDHKCPGPKKPEAAFPFIGLLNRSKKENSKTSRAPTSSSKWATSFLNVASNVRASAEAGVAKLTSEFGQA